jgi:UDP-glucuronate 4-epimerase
MAIPSSFLVTGGAGFIGSHLCEALLRRGRRVVILDNLNDFYSPATKIDNLEAVRRTAAEAGASLSIVRGDLRQADDLMRALGILGQPGESVVIHLAAMAGVRPSIERPHLYYEVNVTGTLNLLEACRRLGFRRIVFASSSSVYGTNEKVPFSEDDPVDHPISPYAATKKAGELLCHTYHHLHRFSIAGLRFFTVYGPRQRPDLAIHKFARLIRDGRSIPFFGDGTTRRDYTYIEDILQGVLGAVEWLAESVAPVYDIFNLGESRTVELSALVDLLGRALGSRPVLERLPLQAGDVLCTFADIDKARRLLGYAPQTMIEPGIPKFVEWFCGGYGRS